MKNDTVIFGDKRLPPFISYSFLFLIYISTFRVFATLPLDNLHQVISIVAIVTFTLYYVFSTFLNVINYRITRLDIVMWLFIIVNFFAAFTGHSVFGQPYYYGIMAQRSVLLSLSGILLISLLNRGLISIKSVERSFLIVSLVLLFTCYFFLLFVNPSHFINDQFVTYSPIRGYRYRFQFALVVMLLFYSLFKISHEKKSWYSFIVLLILFYMVYFLQSRTTLVVLFITLMIYFYRNFSWRQKIKRILIYGSMIVAALIIFISLGYTSLIDKYKLLYNNVLDAFANDSSVEASSAIRFMEYNTALDYIRKNPLLGNGFISSQWNGGYNELFGYFYPVDIGILGNVFVYGLLGTIIIYLPYYFSLKMSKKIKTDNVFFKTCEYMLLFFFFSMFFSAVNIRDSSSIMFLVCLIYYFRYHYRSEYSDSDNRLKSTPV